VRPLRLTALLLLTLFLGLATTITTSLALARWMPLEVQSRHLSYAFIADGRPWSAVERRARGLWLIWWNELDAQFFSVAPTPRQYLQGSLRALLRQPPPEPDPGLPQSAEEWTAYYRTYLEEAGVHNTDHPPAWGSFAKSSAPPDHVRAGADHGFGWPRPALWFRVEGVKWFSLDIARARVFPTASATGIDGGYLLTDPSTLQIRGFNFRALPYRIHWPGLLTNTAFFAILWFLLLFIPAAARRALRRRAGRCLTCGYDLRGLQAGPCPECGAERTSKPPRGIAPMIRWSHHR
jgi:hypothetical protein